jgi:CheY-like chemotaxis protein
MEAITIFREHPEIDLVLMDFKLPDIPGQEVTQQILTIRKETPVIATTAYAMSGDREKALQSGCVDYLPKPIRAEDLATMLRRYLDREMD